MKFEVINFNKCYMKVESLYFVNKVGTYLEKNLYEFNLSSNFFSLLSKNIISPKKIKIKPIPNIPKIPKPGVLNSINKRTSPTLNNSGAIPFNQRPIS